MPSLWSGTKGVHVPISMKAAKQTAGAVKMAWQNKKYGMAVGEALKMPLALRPFGTGGTRVMAFKDMSAQADRLKGGLKSLRNERIQIKAKLDKWAKGVSTQRQRYLGAVKQRRDRFYLFAEDLRNMKSAHARSLSTRRVFDKVKPKYERKMHILQRKEQWIKKKLGRYAAAQGARTATKWAIRAAKVGSVIGATMFAWDMAKMVGEPIGRAVVGQLDTALTEWEDRFMPELGGRMQMTYLTQGASTERQRALQAMSKAQITGRSAFGQESKYVHQ
jgi:hypothetical protein